ncbi:hypothetical protein [Bailinhaonella thermotolerans]|uniref:Uncharacterized protein n=1 Tax=Bailinhaonella thermotolerans TaxID=1070861 RepID=A0A3A4B2K0_9ACTN|nr:hypothetical protein [Bailinhaonella thermotolerans]RJL31620.1 hypothetical protein D5H75_18055 [Bailinhaonella thermotolerans]
MRRYRYGTAAAVLAAAYAAVVVAAAAAYLGGAWWPGVWTLALGWPTEAPAGMEPWAAALLLVTGGLQAWAIREIVSGPRTGDAPVRLGGSARSLRWVLYVTAVLALLQPVLTQGLLFALGRSWPAPGGLLLTGADVYACALVVVLAVLVPRALARGGPRRALIAAGLPVQVCFGLYGLLLASLIPRAFEDAAGRFLTRVWPFDLLALALWLILVLVAMGRDGRWSPVTLGAGGLTVLLVAREIPAQALTAAADPYLGPALMAAAMAHAALVAVWAARGGRELGRAPAAARAAAVPAPSAGRPA